jgi:hypothetical protein
MSTNNLSALKELIDLAFDAVGSRMPVEQDGNAVYARDLIIEEDNGEFLCFEAKNPDSPLFTMPVGSVDGAAAAVVIHILKGIISRAVSKS